MRLIRNPVGSVYQMPRIWVKWIVGLINHQTANLLIRDNELHFLLCDCTTGD